MLKSTRENKSSVFTEWTYHYLKETILNFEKNLKKIILKKMDGIKIVVVIWPKK
jgi:hypothetical protein